jgi:5-methylcytosine-specific restriction endonuclease McrA
MPKACSICGGIALQGTSRCARHPKPSKRGRRYADAARIVRANAMRCHICGEGWRPDDPWVADHIIPRTYGGSDDIENLAEAHASCNGRRGAKQTNVG